MKETVIGECKLCGQNKPLTFEHVPPSSSFNSYPVKKFENEEVLKILTGCEGRMPWDFNGLNGDIIQRGGGGYYLCSNCNTQTGSWYIAEYTKFTSRAHNLILENNMSPRKSYSIRAEAVYPLRLFKAIMTMFCDLNYNCFGDNDLRQFLLNKKSRDYNRKKYSVYLYLVNRNMRRISGLSCMLINNIVVSVSEMASYPIGVTMLIDKPENFIPPGALINDFADCDYDTQCTIDFENLPF